MKNRLHLLLAAACLSWVSQAGAAELGKNFAGESCRLGAAPAPDAAAVIACGDSTEAAGQMWVVVPDRPFPKPANAHRDAILHLIASESEDEKLDCAAPQWVGTGSVVLRICALRSNGWPRIVLGAELGGRVYRAQGAPSLLPALEAALASGAQTALAPADTNALQTAVREKFPETVLKSSAADYASYGKLVEEARLAAASHDYAAAEADDRGALAIEERLFGRDAMVVGETLAELALQASNQGHFAEAAALFRRARPIIEASANADARARLDSYMALDAANARNYKSALSYAAAATATRRTALGTGGGPDVQPGNSGAQPTLADSGELAHSLRIEAEMALRLGNLALARADAEEAIWIVTEQPGLPLWWRADTVALMGEVNEADGRVVQAEHDFRDARDLDHTLFGNTAPTALADFTLGEFYVRQQLYPAALDAFRAGFDIAKKDRTARAEIQPDVLAEFAAAESGAAGGKVSPDGASEIFRDVQLSGSGVVEQAIGRMAALEAATKPGLPDLIARAGQAERERDRAQVELAAEYAKLDEERDAGREQRLAATVKLASATADDLAGKLRASYPDYASLSAPAAAELDATQSKLAPGEAMVIYLVGARSSYALVIRAKSFAAIPLTATRDSLAADLANLRSALRPALGRLPAFSLQNAYLLYRQLIEPFQNQLAGADHLIVVPGPTLAALPFDLLVSRPPDPGHERDYQHADWLLRQFAVSTLPSPRAFAALRDEKQQRNAARRPFLGVGAPAFHGSAGVQGAKALADLTTACREEGPIAPSLLRALPPLPETAAEVETVGASVGNGHAVLLLGDQATESNFRSEPLDQYAVIYLATHGLLPGEMRCATEPALVFSPPAAGATNADSDGLLNASEIAQLKLNANLVVLSACNTAEDPDGPGGESLEGLSDAFFVAGTHAVLASHWEIASASTKTLMTDMFARAHGGEGLAEALRQSQLDMIARPQTSHPFYWGAFTLIGDGGPLRANSAQQSAEAARWSRS
jgi:CHAT domain-containing protein